MKEAIKMYQGREIGERKKGFNTNDCTKFLWY